MLTKKVILSLVAGFMFFSCSLIKNTQGRSGKEPQLPVAKTSDGKIDTTKNNIRKYSDIITNKAITQNGLFKVHKVNEQYYFEIADSILGKDILIVNRISKAAAGVRPLEGYLGYAGDYIGENVVRFTKGDNDRIFIKRISFLDVSRDSSENGMYRSVYNSNLQPIVASFKIKAFSPDSSSSVIDLTEFINGDNDIFFFNPEIKKMYGLGAMQADKSYPQNINSYPLNTEIKAVKTYTRNDKLLTYELNSSLVLLPAIPMKPRIFDERVGYFARGYLDFDIPQNVKPALVINRWRLEPKDEDTARYNRGELVEPKKPIVFYIDPATPKKWVPYLIQGVNEWQKAFEKAGFKHAIYALEAPTNDSTWSLDDARHNVIVYKASYFQNASGPQISDPRTGEILESHINWYHNVQKILHDWYFIQAGPNDKRAQTMQFDDTLMGQLIKYVCTHEVGHTIGLQHNFFASGTIPTDSLRSRNYVSKWGHTPSIMDYARFNYVAQPEDSIAVKDLIPRIGIYDEWAVEWGYRWLPQLKTKEDEKEYMVKWVIQSITKDKRLMYGGANSTDIRTGAEDLGDDPVKASVYGIKNLQRVMDKLVEWTRVKNTSYDNMIDLKKQIWFVQYWLYLNNVRRTIGAYYWTPKTYEENGPVIGYVSKEKQRAAVQFMQEYLFETPKWIDNRKIFYLIGGSGFFNIADIQNHFLHSLINGATQYTNMLFNTAYQSPDKAYSYDEMLTDLETGIWKELRTGQKIEFERKTLQKIYITELINFIRENKGGWEGKFEGCSVVEEHMKRLRKLVEHAIPVYKDNSSKLHLEDVLARLTVAIAQQKKSYPEAQLKRGEFNGNADGFRISGSLSTNPQTILEEKNLNCWDNPRPWENDN